jgi:hypothetical protein
MTLSGGQAAAPVFGPFHYYQIETLESVSESLSAEKRLRSQPGTRLAGSRNTCSVGISS